MLRFKHSLVTKYYAATCSLPSGEMKKRILRIKLENSWVGIKTSKQVTRRVKLNVSMFSIFCLFGNAKKKSILNINFEKEYFFSSFVHFCVFFCLHLQCLSHAAIRFLCIMHFAVKYTYLFAFSLKGES